jgi:hypothetical protein
MHIVANQELSIWSLLSISAVIVHILMVPPNEPGATIFWICHQRKKHGVRSPPSGTAMVGDRDHLAGDSEDPV